MEVLSSAEIAALRSYDADLCGPLVLSATYAGSNMISVNDNTSGELKEVHFMTDAADDTDGNFESTDVTFSLHFTNLPDGSTYDVDFSKILTFNLYGCNGMNIYVNQFDMAETYWRIDSSAN
jgi:hypothetical protein